MIEDLIIIIPTHNRQNYLGRVIRYYSSFPCKVYICDSSKQKAEVETPENISYRWVPQSNFYGKVLDVLNEASADFYALSPDDDFLKQETLMECYEEMRGNPKFTLGTGMQVFFNKPFNGTFYLKPGANNLLGFREMVGESNDDYIKRFWNHYQNILWSLFRKDILVNAFTTLFTCNFKNGNFVEIILGIESLRNGEVYVSSNGLNYREVTKEEHWGNSISSITKENIKNDQSIQNDIISLKNYYNEDGGFSYRLFKLYLEGDYYSRNHSLFSKIKSVISDKWKKYIKMVIPSMFYEFKLVKVDDNVMSLRINSVL